jgi:DNA-binding NarL/FixJ family response regulator
LAEGRSNKEVAAVLNISTRTVENHRAKVMEKLKLHSLGELVRYAVRNNIVEP